MNRKETDNRDEALGKLLQEWRFDNSLPPRFQEGVWRRIAQVTSPARASLWSAISTWIATMLSRPALASAYVALLIAIGVTAGWTEGRQENARVKSSLGEQYVRMLDPYAMPRQ